MTSVLVRHGLAAGLAAAALLAAPASAALAPADGFVAANLPAAERASTVVTVTDFDVTGIFSVDPFGDPLNEVFNIPLAPNASVIGIGWDVTFFADAPSWLSEAVVAFGSSSTPVFVTLTVGVGDDFPGTSTYSSGGIISLVPGLDFAVDGDGILRLEFFESFDDFPDDWDGIWQSGTLSIQWSVPGGVIPEPGTWAMMIAGFGLVGLMARRRRGTATA